MDQLLRRENLDLRLSPYRCLATSSKHGMVEYVDAVGIADILRTEGTLLDFFRFVFNFFGIFITKVTLQIAPIVFLLFDVNPILLSLNLCIIHFFFGIFLLKIYSKLYMNVNIMTTQIFNEIKYDPAIGH